MFIPESLGINSMVKSVLGNSRIYTVLPHQRIARNESRTKPKVPMPEKWVKQRTGVISACTQLYSCNRQIMAVIPSLFTQLDPGTEVACVRPDCVLLCTGIVLRVHSHLSISPLRFVFLPLSLSLGLSLVISRPHDLFFLTLFWPGKLEVL